MPFPGVPVGSDLEKKIDRCVATVTATGRDKSTAIAICRSSIEGKGADGTPIYAHGPGGLLSALGLGRKKKETTKGHEGAMISLTVPANIAQQFALGDVEGALPASELHVTLAFLGKAADLSDLQIRNLQSVLQAVAQSYKPLQAAINGVARFCNNDPEGDAFFVIPDIPDLPGLRQDLVERLAAKNIPYSTDHGFVPHITLAYIPHDAENPFSQIERVEGVVFPSINLTLAGERHEYPFRVETTKDRADAIDQARYRDAGPANTQVCGTCKFAQGGNCTLFDFRFDPTWTCDRWLPNIAATRARLRTLQAENKERLMNRQKMISDAKQILTLKREIAASVRRDLPRADFAFPDTRSFPIQRPEDVRAAVSSLPAEWKQAASQKSSFNVFKDHNDRYRWLMISSSAYEDRDREIVSQKALRSAVAEHDARGERGPLRWWHLPIDIGETDFGMMSGKMLIESGTFKSERIGGAIAAHIDELGASIGFDHPKDEPKSGVFENIKIFERSVLPKEKASNYFVKLTIKEFQMSDEKVKEFINLVGPEVAAQFLTDVSTTDKGAEDAGFRYKSHDDLAEMSADELLEYSLLRKEHEEAEAAKQAEASAKAAKADDGDDEKKPGDDGGMMGRLNRMVKMIEANSAAIKAMRDRYSKKETDDTAAQLDARLAALESEQPRALAEGYRATQGTDNIVTDKKEVEQNPVDVAAKEALERAPQAEPFMSAATSMVNGLTGGHPYWGNPPAPGPQK